MRGSIEAPSGLVDFFARYDSYLESPATKPQTDNKE